VSHLQKRSSAGRKKDLSQKGPEGNQGLKMRALFIDADSVRPSAAIRTLASGFRVLYIDVHWAGEIEDDGLQDGSAATSRKRNE
jgi:hypothetical protein